MAKVASENGVDLLDPRIGDRLPVEWVVIDNPDLAPQSFTEAPHEAANMASGPFVQGRDTGGVRFSRLEAAGTTRSLATSRLEDRWRWGGGA
jgi:hypothetical protein